MNSKNEILKCDTSAAVALNLGILFHDKIDDIDHFHVSLAHSQKDFLKETAKQCGIQLTGELVSCLACLRANEKRAITPHHTTGHATSPLDLVKIATVGSYLTSLRGVSVRRDDCGQYLATTATIRDS